MSIRITRREVHRRFAAGMLAAAVLGPLGIAGPARAEPLIFASGGAAIDGYDPVAYFATGKPVKGNAQFSHEWMGAKWRFASAANRDAFAGEPEKYAPQYGGYCAWAVAQGYTAPIDPAAWRVVDGKLYLNYSKSIQSRWVEDIPGNIAKAETNWPKIKAGLTR